jgi:hypothetical protein
MGESSEGITASNRGSKNIRLGSGEAHDVASRSQETFGVPKSEMGTD